MKKDYAKECKTTLLLEEIIAAVDIYYYVDGERHTNFSLSVNPNGGIRIKNMDPAWEEIIDQLVADHDKVKKDKNEKDKEKADKDKADAEKALKQLGLTKDEVGAIMGG